mmetsp:Transcript_33018/g.60882  ORF Transcript_33018/g.60882 Transcript_33018/m.60882 type:complete len:562 (-) Transcript_33018:34-1719(-)
MVQVQAGLPATKQTQKALYSVVHDKVIVRSAPDITSSLMGVVKRGQEFIGRPFYVDGSPWLFVDAADLRSKARKSEVAVQEEDVGKCGWMLIDGKCVGLGDLLRLTDSPEPSNGKADQDEQSASMESDDGKAETHAKITKSASPKRKQKKKKPVSEDDLEKILQQHRDCFSDSGTVDILMETLTTMGLVTGSQLLSETETPQTLQIVQHRVEVKADNKCRSVPDNLVKKARDIVHDNRIVLSKMPKAEAELTTLNPILFTAPHSLFLHREGHSHHVPEYYTARLARNFASAVGGASLTWAEEEEGRILKLHELTGDPDPTNADPNFTNSDNLVNSPWTRKLREARELFREGEPCLHVDVHGCRDPGPDSADPIAHLIVGLRAMEFAERVDVEELRSELSGIFAALLRGFPINLRPRTLLTGAWPDDRRTLSQQSLSKEGGRWTHAVQLEMSHALRTQLIGDRELRALLANGIRLAWTTVLANCCFPTDEDEVEKASKEMKSWLNSVTVYHARKANRASRKKRASAQEAVVRKEKDKVSQSKLSQASPRKDIGTQMSVAGGQ